MERVLCQSNESDANQGGEDRGNNERGDLVGNPLQNSDTILD